MKLGNEFDIIVKAINTEKTARSIADSKFCFQVVKTATKDNVKEAFQNIFGVIVESVNVINTKGKVKKYKGTKGKRSSVKKAVVTVKKGQDINLGKLE